MTDYHKVDASATYIVFRIISSVYIFCIYQIQRSTTVSVVEVNHLILYNRRTSFICIQILEYCTNCMVSRLCRKANYVIHLM